MTMRYGTTKKRSLLNLLPPFLPVHGQQACMSTCARNSTPLPPSEPPQKPIGFLAGKPSDPFLGNVPLSFLGLNEKTKMFKAVNLLTWKDVVSNASFQSHFPPDTLSHEEGSAPSLSEAQFPAPMSTKLEPEGSATTQTFLARATDTCSRAEEQQRVDAARRRRQHAVHAVEQGLTRGQRAASPSPSFFRPRPARSARGASRIHHRVAWQQQQQQQQQQLHEQQELPLDPASAAVTTRLWPELRERRIVGRGGDWMEGAEPESSPSSSEPSCSSSSSSSRVAIQSSEHSSSRHGGRGGQGRHTALMHSCDSIGQSEQGSANETLGQREQGSGCSSMGQHEQGRPQQSDLRGGWEEGEGVPSSSSSSSCHSCHDETTSFPSGLHQHASSVSGWFVEDNDEDSSSNSSSEGGTEQDWDEMSDDEGEEEEVEGVFLKVSHVDDMLSDVHASREQDAFFSDACAQWLASREQEESSPPARTRGGLVFGFWRKAPLG